MRQKFWYTWLTTTGKSRALEHTVVEKREYVHVYWTSYTLLFSHSCRYEVLSHPRLDYVTGHSAIGAQKKFLLWMLNSHTSDKLLIYISYLNMGGRSPIVVRLLTRFFDRFARIVKRVAKKGRPILGSILISPPSYAFYSTFLIMKTKENEIYFNRNFWANGFSVTRPKITFSYWAYFNLLSQNTPHRKLKSEQRLRIIALGTDN